MKQRNLFNLFGAIILFCIYGMLGHAQDQVQWLVNNLSSPTVVPLYANQASPFPVQQEANNQIGSVEQAKANLEAKFVEQQNILNALITTQKAFQPNAQEINLTAIINGPLGPRALINRQWMSPKQQFQVPSEASQEYLEALRQLKELDPQAIDPLAQNYQKINIIIQSITSESVVLEAPYQTIKLTLKAND